ncbi:hypothetical protein FQA47_015543 [Oryzias melastigma]|uniref:Uncharacterized protein n=1 Tax=Oryzias melastigma TaxID=30732 RepID=A0A834L092_ORYME|nr:hypothetical protein FQA47_015543 [Oryzias melastigma]
MRRLCLAIIFSIAAAIISEPIIFQAWKKAEPGMQEEQEEQEQQEQQEEQEQQEASDGSELRSQNPG